MTDSRDTGALVLRVALGALFLAHAGLKILVFTPAGTAAFFGKLGLAARTRLPDHLCRGGGRPRAHRRALDPRVSLTLVPLLLGTIVTVHGANGFWFNAPGGGWEYPAFWTAALVAQALIGPGAYAVRLPRHATATA